MQKVTCALLSRTQVLLSAAYPLYGSKKLNAMQQFYCSTKFTRKVTHLSIGPPTCKALILKGRATLNGLLQVLSEHLAHAGRVVMWMK